ncbi:MAG: hypothetical protein Q8O64_16505 [Sideroxyarcus sp.]|nr:hypothetical protein [Sideroxyarcus sp.]
MTRLISIIIFTLIGFGVGYVIFGKWSGEYVSMQTLFSFGGNPVQGAFRSLTGIEDMRNKVLWSGVAGAVVGLLLAFKRK